MEGNDYKMSTLPLVVKILQARAAGRSCHATRAAESRGIFPSRWSREIATALVALLAR